MITGNYFNKYESKNPLVKSMVRKFKKTLNTMVQQTKAKKILDVGCGEGYLMDFLLKENKGSRLKITGIDITDQIIKKAKDTHPHLEVHVGSAYKIPYPDNSFDCVTINEVMEHLDHFSKALYEVRRVSKKYVIVSVPHEPWWRIVNMARLKYLKDFGNTPGHVNHWTRGQLKRLLKAHFKKVTIKGSTLWNFALCEK